VAPVRLERAPTLAEADQDHRSRVVERDRHHQQGDQDAERGIIRAGERADHRQHPEQEPEEVAPGVSHEQAGRVTVMDQEPAQGPDQDQQRPRHEQPLDAELGDREQEGGDQANARRQAVHVVEEVEGVGQPHDPQDRQAIRPHGVVKRPE
jgi:hypothetical protein